VLSSLLLSASVCDVGDYVQLTCIASRGATPILFEWWLDGRQVHDDGDDDVTQATVGEHTSLLLINRAGEGHAGNYSCRAINQVGVAERRSRLTVNGNLGESDMPLPTHFRLLLLQLIQFFSTSLILSIFRICRPKTKWNQVDWGLNTFVNMWSLNSTSKPINVGQS